MTILIGRVVWLTTVMAPAALLASLHAQQATFRSAVDLIAVDVQVVDKHGGPIASLGSDRFEVFINGSKRRVLSAQLIVAAPGAAGPPVRPIVSGPIAMNHWLPTGPGRALVLAIDSSSFEADIWQRTQRSAHAFLSLLDANDRIGLLAYPFGPVVDLTSDRARVIRALGATVGASQTLRTPFHLSPAEIIDISAETARSTSPGTAVRRTRAGALEGGSDAPTIQRVQDRECPNDPNCAARILMDADNSANLLEARAAQGVAGLRSLLTVLAGLEGRKTVVLLSGGMAVSDIPGGRPVIDDLARTLGEQLAQANAAIYTLHFDSNLRSAVSATRQRIDLGSADSVRETTLMGRWLEQFSASSGGALLRVQTDDGESAFQRVLRESSAYYLLGVEPAASDRTGQLRELKVKVQQRGATVRHRNWVIVPKRGA